MSKVKIIPDLRFPEFENEGDWQKKPLEDVLQFQTGFPFDSEGFNEEGRGVRLIKNRDLKSDDKIVHYSKPYDEKYLVTNGDVLVGMDGDFTPIKWNKGVALLNQRVGRVLTNQKDDELFFLYFLSIHLKAIEEKTARTTVKHLSHSVVEKINEPIPKPKEQQKIASCLSSLDNLIAAHSQKLDLLKDHKKGLMQNLFPQEGEKVPKYRFKEFENDGEWVEEPLSSKVSVIDGDRGLNYPKAEEYSSDGYCLFLSAKNVTKSGFLFNEFQFITKEKDELLRKGKLARFDIVLTTRGSLGQFAFFDENIQFENIRINSGMVILRAKDNGINPNYLYSYFNSYSIQSAIKSQGFGNAVQQLTVAVINNFTLRYPYDPKEQQKIASCLSSLDALITAQAEKIEQLKLHKKGLMQGMFPKIEI